MYISDETRYDKMVYNRVGKSGLKFPAVSLGFWHNFGSGASFDNMKAICETAFDNGVTQFDLANNYGPVPGSAEENFGRILDKSLRPYRDELVITTKAGYDMWKGPYGDFGSRKYLIASLDQSLRRMKLDYVDVFYHHRPDPETPLEETAEALAQIVRSGKALYVGISNYGLKGTQEMTALLREKHVPFIVNQRAYNLFNRSIETEGTKKWCAENGVGIIAYSPLAQGLLTDRYLHGIPADSRLGKGAQWLHESDLDAHIDAIRALNEIAAQRGQTLADMALAWILRDGDVCSVICGASRPSQILDDVRAVQNTAFSEEELRKIDKITLG